MLDNFCLNPFCAGVSFRVKMPADLPMSRYEYIIRVVIWGSSQVKVGSCSLSIFEQNIADVPNLIHFLGAYMGHLTIAIFLL